MREKTNRVGAVKFENRVSQSDSQVNSAQRRKKGSGLKDRRTGKEDKR